MLQIIEQEFARLFKPDVRDTFRKRRALVVCFHGLLSFLTVHVENIDLVRSMDAATSLDK
jgi:hypothetical protein